MSLTQKHSRSAEDENLQVVRPAEHDNSKPLKATPLHIKYSLHHHNDVTIQFSLIFQHTGKYRVFCTPKTCVLTPGICIPMPSDLVPTDCNDGDLCG